MIPGKVRATSQWGRRLSLTILCRSSAACGPVRPGLRLGKKAHDLANQLLALVCLKNKLRMRRALQDHQLFRVRGALVLLADLRQSQDALAADIITGKDKQRPSVARVGRQSLPTGRYDRSHRGPQRPPAPAKIDGNNTKSGLCHRLSLCCPTLLVESTSGEPVRPHGRLECGRRSRSRITSAANEVTE